jgi:hypothetical protein
MASITNGSLPRDVVGFPAEGVYVPNVGTVAQQGGPVLTDSNNQPYAPTVALLTAGTALAGAVALSDGLNATYSASITALASAASCTDLFTITGSATKTIRITRLEISGQATTAAAAQVVLLVRSAANLTGTSTTPTVVPHDSASAAGTAVVRAYTVNPGTLGTLVGNIRTDYVFLAAPATATVGSDKLFLDFGTRPSQAIVLRGIAQVLAVNLNAATVTGGAFDINLEWTES